MVMELSIFPAFLRSLTSIKSRITKGSIVLSCGKHSAYEENLFFGFALREKRISIALASLICLCSIANLRAATEWKTNGSGNWGAGMQNWTNGLPSSTSTARFVQSQIGTNLSINLNGNREALGLFANQAGQTQIVVGDSASNTLTIGSGGIEVTQAPNGPAPGRIRIDANVVLAAPQSWLAKRNGSGDDILLFGPYSLGLGSHELTVNSPGNTTIATAINGTGFIDKKGNGILTLQGNNSFSGGIIVNAGTLRIPNDAALGSGGVVLNGGTFRIESPTTINNGITFSNSSLLAIEGNNVSITSAIGGSGNWEKSGSGTLTLSATNNNIGTLNVAGGAVAGPPTSHNAKITTANFAAVQFTSGGVYGGSISGAGGINKLGGGVVVLTGANTPAGTTIAGGGLQATTSSLDGPVNIGPSQEFYLDQNFNGTYEDAITGGGSLYKRGSGTVSLTAVNSYTGGSFVQAGRLQGTTDSLKGTFSVSQDASVSFSQNTSGTYSGGISGNGTLWKYGTGTVTLGGSNSYTGLTWLRDGNLVVNTSSLPGDASLNTGTSLTFNQTPNGTYSGQLSGPGKLRKNGSSTITLTNNHTHTGGSDVVLGTLNLTGSLLGPVNVLVVCQTSILG